MEIEQKTDFSDRQERKTDRRIDRIFRVLRLVLRNFVALYLIFQYFYYHAYALKYPPYSLYFAVLGLFVFYGDEMKMLFIMYQEWQDKKTEKVKNRVIADAFYEQNNKSNIS